MITTPRVCQEPGPVRGAFMPAPAQRPALASGLLVALTNCRHFLPSPAGLSRGHFTQPPPELESVGGRAKSLPRTTRTRLSAAHHQY